MVKFPCVLLTLYTPHKDVYVKHMENVLKDNMKFEKVDIKIRALNFKQS